MRKRAKYKNQPFIRPGPLLRLDAEPYCMLVGALSWLTFTQTINMEMVDENNKHFQ